ncbi:MAG: response regulator [Actinomycetota bacterium]|nr:response regulator [Actinomycetota bacterium]
MSLLTFPRPSPAGPSLAAELSPRRRLALRTAFAVAALGVVACVARGTTGLGAPGTDDFFTRWVYPALYLVPAGICLARAVAIPRERRVWAVFALGLATWAPGYLYYNAFVRHLDPVPYPTLSDAFWLSFYAASYVGLVLLLRQRMPEARKGLWMDGLVAGLALAAVFASVLVEPIVESTGGSAAAVITNFSYPLADVAIFGFLVGVFAATGWRPGRAWVLIAAAFAIQSAFDVLYLYRAAAGTYAPGTVLDAVWPGVWVLLAYAAWRRPDAPRAATRRTWDQLIIPSAATLIAVFVLVYDDFHEISNVATFFAAAALIAGFARTALTLAQLRAATARQDLLARNSSILEAAGEGIYGLDREGRATFANAAAARMLGYSPDGLVGRRLHELIHQTKPDGSAYPEEECPACASLEHGSVQRVSDDVYRRKDGTSFTVEFTATPIREGERVTGTVVVFRDVSERRAVERMKDEFTSVVSHELRTPLTSIRGSLGLLQSGVLGALPEKGQRMLDIAVQNSDRLVRLINDILDIERMESGRVTMDKQGCDARELVERATAEMRTMAHERGVTLAVAAEEARLWADPDRLIQTLTNLLSNAVKFSEPGATVRISAGRRGEEVRFEVSDEGRGIPADKLEAIFDRFQQVDASDSREKGGTGLGLAICSSIVTQHGGRIWAESAPGEGARFTFALPALPAEPAGAPVPPPADAPVVLMCDDDRSIREVVGAVLERGGYRVVSAASGEEAVERAIEHRPAAILLDLLMPGMDGCATAAALRARPETADIPLVILSVLGPEDADGAPADVAGWVTKPFEEASLLEALDGAVGAGVELSRVLVVEDDPDLAGVLTAMFERHGLETFHAGTGREAIALSQEVLPDLLVLDLMLPEGDGFSVADWLRQHHSLHAIPLVVYTAKDLDDSDRERLRLGRTEFLTKGRVSPAEFEERVTRLLGRIARHDTEDGKNGRQAHPAHR